MLQEAEKFVDQKVAGIKGGTLNQFEHHHELRALPPKGLNPAGAQTGHSSGIASSHTDSISFNSGYSRPGAPQDAPCSRALRAPTFRATPAARS